MKIYQAALYPFSVLYDGATRLRNSLFEHNIRQSYAFSPVVMNVGNLSVGGTGKTPMIEYLVQILHNRFKVAILSRGYGRKTAGFRLAGEQDNACTLGDEPFQLYQAWKTKVVVAVGEKRASAIPRIMAIHPDVEVVLLDDAYQHRTVQRDLNILLTTWEKPFFRDYVLPAGRLRESRKGALRADLIVVTKCPSSPSEEKMEKYKAEISAYARQNVPVYFSTLAYDLPQPFKAAQGAIGEKVVLVSGLAKAKPFEEMARKQFIVLKHFQYADHYNYTLKDLKKMVAFVRTEPGCSILTTEKDAAKWKDPLLMSELSGVPVFTLPVRHSFTGRINGRKGRNGTDAKEDFEARILEVFNKTTKK